MRGRSISRSTRMFGRLRTELARCPRTGRAVRRHRDPRGLDTVREDPRRGHTSSQQARVAGSVLPAARSSHRRGPLGRSKSTRSRPMPRRERRPRRRFEVPPLVSPTTADRLHGNERDRTVRSRGSWGDHIACQVQFAVESPRLSSGQRRMVAPERYILQDPTGLFRRPRPGTPCVGSAVVPKRTLLHPNVRPNPSR